MNEYKSTLTPEEVDAAFKNMANLENGIAAANSAAKLSQSWAVGGTGTREGEDTNNAQYWAQQAQKVAQGAQGWYETEESLRAAHPTGENGQWAIVGSTDTIWTWDSDTSAWVNTGSQMDLSGYYTKEQADERFATSEQGGKADSAVQSVNGVRPGSGGAVTIDIPQVPTGLDVDNKITISSTTWTAPSDGIIMLYSTDSNNIMYQKNSSGGWVGIALAARGQSAWNQIPVPVFKGSEYQFSIPNAEFFPYKYN